MDAPYQTNGDQLQNLTFNSVVYQNNPRTAASTSVGAMNKENVASGGNDYLLATSISTS
jgi:hypothetical protein